MTDSHKESGPKASESINVCAPFFSIVVPMYNVEKYIEDCLKSVFSQSFKSVQLIVIDDGSTDASVAKSLALFEQGYEFLLLGQCQKGPNVARNLALEHVKGKYILFMDADDKLADAALEKLHSELCVHPQIDVLSFGYEFFDDDSGSIRAGVRPLKRSLKSDDIFSEALTGRDFGGVCWNKCYGREFLLGNNISFVPDKTHGRDLLFSRTVALRAREWETFEEVIYYSRYRAGSFSRKFSEHNVYSAIDVADMHLKLFHDAAAFRGVVALLNYAIHRHLRYIVLLSAFRAKNYLEFKNHLQILRRSSLVNFLSWQIMSSRGQFLDRVMSALTSMPILCWVLARTLKKFKYEPY